jgi:hypothetical protein
MVGTIFFTNRILGFSFSRDTFDRRDRSLPESRASTTSEVSSGIHLN